MSGLDDEPPPSVDLGREDQSARTNAEPNQLPLTDPEWRE
jgi:hypothetical protein